MDGIEPTRKLRYHLKSIRFHAPTEHLIDGKKHDFEAHFIHELEPEQLKELGEPENRWLILAVMFDCTYAFPNSWLNVLGLEDFHEVQVRLNGFMRYAMGREGYYYVGSYSEPDCDEPVHWIVMQRLQMCVNDQIDLFTSRIKDNYRKEMPTNGRQVYDARLG